MLEDGMLGSVLEGDVSLLRSLLYLIRFLLLLMALVSVFTAFLI